MYQAPKARPRELWNTHYVSVLYIKRRTITRGEHNIHDPRSTRDRPETDPRPTRDRPETDPRSTLPQGFYPPRVEIDPRSTRDRHERSTQHSIPQSRDSPRLTDIDPTVLLGTRPRGAFCPTGFLPSAGRDRPEIDPRPARAINPTFYPPKPPLWGTPPPSPRASVSFASRQWGAGGGAKNEQGRLGRGGSILKTADRGGVFSHRVLPSA